MKLEPLIPASHFRTVESFQMPKAKSELKVEIDLKDDFMKKIGFSLPWDGKLYAYFRITESFRSFCKERDLNVSDIDTIYLEDWDLVFSVIIETRDKGRELSFYVSTEDVNFLLENCCRVPSQKG